MDQERPGTERPIGERLHAERKRARSANSKSIRADRSHDGEWERELNDERFTNTTVTASDRSDEHVDDEEREHRNPCRTGPRAHGLGHEYEAPSSVYIDSMHATSPPVNADRNTARVALLECVVSTSTSRRTIWAGDCSSDARWFARHPAFDKCRFDRFQSGNQNEPRVVADLG